jgi:ubiquinone/menaquinone biosynthesis C-methylase UbiE
MLKLNLGSGNNRVDGFVSVDLYDEEADIRADICELPYDNNSVDEIVCYQVVEHVPYNKSAQMFEEMHRVLKPGGSVIIETPDIDVVCRKILEEGLADKWIYNLVGEYYRPWDKDRYDDWEMNAASIHRNPWNFNRLVEVAKHAGFSKVERRESSEYYPYEENMSCLITK